VLALAATASAQTPPPPPTSTSVAAPAPGPASPAKQTVEPPPALPPHSLSKGDWNIIGDTEMVGSIRRVKGHPAEIETDTTLFRGDEIEYDSDTGNIKASGHVYFRDFDKNEQIWCSRLEYNKLEETGKFYDVIGETTPRIVVRRGVLPSSSPFHFEGEWAERKGDKYLLYNGWVTNCKLPRPWWRLKGPRFEIVPGESAVSHHSIFLLRKMPILYFPYFYHSLAKNPRKSGFLMPNFVPRSKRGFMVGIGYYWAINRDYDMTYRMQDFTTHAFAHHLDFRGKPRDGTDFGFILYGVQDRGQPQSNGAPPPTYSGANIYAVGRSELGNGWSARGFANYISSFRFRQQWSESYTEAISSELHSVGSIGRNWSDYSFNVTVARLQNFQSSEIQVTDPATNDTHFESNAVNIRKLPEVQLTGRDEQLSSKFPLWFSFDSAAGLLYRSAPTFDGGTLVYRFQTNQFTDRLHLAPHLTTALHLGSFHIIPSIGLVETFYGEGQDRVDGLNHVVGTNIVRSARDFSLDLVFPSLARVFEKKTVFGDKLKHVIEPRATYRYVTGIGEDFNRFIRFDERDLLANTNELLLSVANRIYAKRGDNVQEIFTWELMQKRYFDPTFGGALIPGVRNVFDATSDITAYAFLVGPRSTSPVVSKLRASPITGLGMQWQTEYDPRFGAVVDSDFSLDYGWSKYLVSVGQNEVHNNPTLLAPSANQFTGRFDYGNATRRGINAGLSVVYDYRAQLLRYAISQVTYNTDCCGISVQFGRINLTTPLNPAPRDETIFRISFSIANVSPIGTLRKQDRLF
jgi:LPS-assembly protein